MEQLRDAMVMNYTGAIEMLNNARINLCRRFRPDTSPSVSTIRAHDLSGKICVITGANAGVGLATAKLLAANGANVVMACRNRQRGEAAVKEVIAELADPAHSSSSSTQLAAGSSSGGKGHAADSSGGSHQQGSPSKFKSRSHGGPGNSTDRSSRSNGSCSVTFEQLDLASLASVRDFAKRLQQRHRHIDLLVCNAGIMAPPVRQQTEDGLELQFQVNYLSQWLLASSLLLPATKSASSQCRQQPAAQVIMVTSVTHHGGRLNFDDLQSEKHYDPLKAYADSKLADVMAAQELQRRFDRCGSSNTAVVVDPGILDTYLARNFFTNQVPWLVRGLLQPLTAVTLPWFLLPPSTAAQSMLWAATAPDDKIKGTLVKNSRFAKPVKHAADRAVSDRLWHVSCQLTGLSHDEA